MNAFKRYQDMAEQKMAEIKKEKDEEEQKRKDRIAKKKQKEEEERKKMEEEPKIKEITDEEAEKIQQEIEQVLSVVLNNGVLKELNDGSEDSICFLWYQFFVDLEIYIYMILWLSQSLQTRSRV